MVQTQRCTITQSCGSMPTAQHTMPPLFHGGHGHRQAPPPRRCNSRVHGVTRGWGIHVVACTCRCAPSMPPNCSRSGVKCDRCIMLASATTPASRARPSCKGKTRGGGPCPPCCCPVAPAPAPLPPGPGHAATIPAYCPASGMGLALRSTPVLPYTTTRHLQSISTVLGSEPPPAKTPPSHNPKAAPQPPLFCQVCVPAPSLPPPSPQHQGASCSRPRARTPTGTTVPAAHGWRQHRPPRAAPSRARKASFPPSSSSWWGDQSPAAAGDTRSSSSSAS